jgi:hypothetical protein
MFNGSDITEPGFYWYFEANGVDPVLVEVRPEEAPEPQLEVRLPGRKEWILLTDLSGKFEGPVPPRA